MFGIKNNACLHSIQADVDATASAGLRRPFTGNTRGRFIQHQGHAMFVRAKHLNAGNVQNIVHNFGQALGVLSNHGSQLPVRRFV